MSNNGDSKKYPQGPKRPDTETSPQRIRAARDESRLYVATLADWVQAGFLPFAEAEREVTEYFQALATRFALTPNESASARDAEWQAASRAAVIRLNTLRAVIRSRAWEGAPLVALLAAAQAEIARSSANFGDEHLKQIIDRIAEPIRSTLKRREKRS